MIKFLIQYLIILFLKVFSGLTFTTLVILLSPAYVYRIIIAHLARIFKPSLGAILSAQSALFATPTLASEPEFNVIIHLRLHGNLNFENILDRVCERIIFLETEDGKLVYPEFQQHYVNWMGYPFWKQDKDFSIHDHMKQHTLVDKTQLESTINSILSSPFSQTKSPWEITFISTEDDEASFSICFKFHHSLADGYAIYNTLMECTDSPAQSLKSRPPIKPRAFACLRRSLNLFKSYFRVIQKTFLKYKTQQYLWKASQLHGVRFTTVSDPISLNQIKLISSNFGISVSAVLVSLVTGSIRRKLVQDNEIIPIDMQCRVPISSPLHPKGLTNQVLFMDMKLPVGNPQAEHRASTCEKRIKRERETQSAVIGYLISVLVGKLPKFFHIKPPKIPAVALSIFPGPIAPIAFDSCEVTDMSYAINGNGIHALLVNLMSYNGQFRFWLSADQLICPKQEDMDQLAVYIEQELKEMLDAPAPVTKIKPIENIV